jgi:hypothetical protein
MWLLVLILNLTLEQIGLIQNLFLLQSLRITGVKHFFLILTLTLVMRHILILNEIWWDIYRVLEFIRIFALIICIIWNASFNFLVFMLLWLLNMNLFFVNFFFLEVLRMLLLLLILTVTRVFSCLRDIRIIRFALIWDVRGFFLWVFYCILFFFVFLLGRLFRTFLLMLLTLLMMLFGFIYCLHCLSLLCRSFFLWSHFSIL